MSKGQELSILVLKSNFFIKCDLRITLQKCPELPSKGINFSYLPDIEGNTINSYKSVLAYPELSACIFKCFLKESFGIFWYQTVLSCLFCHFLNTCVINIMGRQAFSKLFLYLSDIILIQLYINLFKDIFNSSGTCCSLKH